MKIYAPWEKAFKKVSTPFEEFLHAQTTTGLILIIMTILALILANSPLYETYSHIFHMNIDLNVGTWALSHSLHHWINDGLMAIFFFIVITSYSIHYTKLYDVSYKGEFANINANIVIIININPVVV